MSSEALPPRDGNAAFTARWWPPVAPRAPVVLGAPPGAAPAYAQAAYTNEINLLAAASEGERNDTLNRAAFNLAQLVASGHLPREQVMGDLHGVAVMVGLTEAETRATLRSAFGAGEKHPRAVPEPSVLDAPPVTELAWPAQPPGAVSVEDLPGVEPPAITETFPSIDWKALWGDETAEEWIVEPILPARRLVALFSPPKIGKSLLMLEVAVAVARGEPVLGATLARPRRVMYVDFENDPVGDLRPRLQAMGMEPDDLTNLVYLSFPRLPYLDTALGGLTLLQLVDAYDVEVVVIDTISRAVGGEENENDTWLAFYRHTGVALKARGIAVMRLDHTGKDASKGMRGGSAKYGDVDAVWSMTELPGQVLKLECTAHRLPITEPVLLVERHTDPLRHQVTTRRIGDVLRDLEREMAVVLDRLDWPRPPLDPATGKRPSVRGFGERQALSALLARPEFTEAEVTLRRVREAMEMRLDDRWIPAPPDQMTIPYATGPVAEEGDE